MNFNLIFFNELDLMVLNDLDLMGLKWPLTSSYVITSSTQHR